MSGDCKAATPSAELERRLMDSRVPKGELEWYAAARIATLTATVERLERERDEALESAERQMMTDSALLARFEENPDAHNWLGWRTVPDEQGREFDVTIQLVGGRTALDRYREIDAENTTLRTERDEARAEAERLRAAHPNSGG